MKSWRSWPLEAKIRLLHRLRAKRHKDEIPDFFDWSLFYMHDYMSLPPSNFHRFLANECAQLHTKRGVRKRYISPRGNAKTTWVSKAYPLFIGGVFGIEPYILLISDTDYQSEKNLESIKHELESNERIAEDFPWVMGKGKTWGQGMIKTRTGVTIEALGSGSKIRGRTSLKDRPTLVIIDDLENDETVQTPDQRRKTWEWLTRAVIPAGTKNTNFLVVGTALHRDDSLQKMAKSPGWDCHTFRSVIKWPTNRNLWVEWEKLYGDPTLRQAEREEQARNFYENNREAMEEGAEVLWPQQESLLDLWLLRTTIGPAAFEAEKQGNPTSSKTNEWEDMLFGTGIWFNKWPETTVRAIAVDMSKGKTDKSDYTAIVEAAVGHDGDIYVDAEIKRMDASQIVTRTLDRAEAFMPDGVGFEINGFQELVKDTFNIETKKRGLPIAAYGINNSLNKMVRIRKLTPFLRSGRFKFKKGSKGAEVLVDQLRDFPTGEHDDGPDALEMVIRLIQFILNPNQNQDDGEFPVHSV